MQSACHLSEGDKPLFTDFTYDNLGVPKNPANPFYAMPRKWNPDGYGWIDPGLGGFLKGTGYQRMSTWPSGASTRCRPCAMWIKRPYEGFVKAFGHNGYFKSLEEITHFYNTRDV